MRLIRRKVDKPGWEKVVDFVFTPLPRWFIKTVVKQIRERRQVGSTSTFDSS